jgi:hypothetical protein
MEPFSIVLLIGGIIIVFALVAKMFSNSGARPSSGHDGYRNRSVNENDLIQNNHLYNQQYTNDYSSGHNNFTSQSGNGDTNTAADFEDNQHADDSSFSTDSNTHSDSWSDSGSSSSSDSSSSSSDSSSSSSSD